MFRISSGRTAASKYMRGNEEPFCRNSETTRVTIGQEGLRTEMPLSGEIAFPQPAFLLTTTMHLPPSARKVGREIFLPLKNIS
ncbi:hypothetical protein QLX08_001481 [Tetragonisca angustula]|uniref:Uncharacterized protein n=1 Tax=Tetragonisca angustula TaxID=166442 RepID=A0AAW1AHS1_9HYME